MRTAEQPGRARAVVFVRGLIAAGAVLLLAVQVVRVAAVDAFARRNPTVAERFWPGHPSVELSSGLIEIANAARQARPVSQAVIDRIFAASIAAPLAEEPFLVRGVQAQLAGDQKMAGEAFAAAKLRDGRSLPARYFLAEYYFRQGNADRGLGEIGALSRLVPGGVRTLAPYVAAYAREPASRARVRSLLQSEPLLEEATLAELSVDPRNADLVLSMADRQRLTGKSAWLPGLLTSLTNAGAYGKARQVWAQVGKVRFDPRSFLFDPGFTNKDAPPPFNWSLTSSTVGLAERASGGGLHVIYYGQEDGALARQLLVLPSGSYRLVAQGASDFARASALRWRLVCAKDSREVASAPLGAATSGWEFVVPADCAGQWLEMFGTAGDLPQQTEITIRALSLTSRAARD